MSWRKIVKPEKTVPAFFLSTQIGILARFKGQWQYLGMIPFTFDIRTQQIIRRQHNMNMQGPVMKTNSC
jgi:hypothetical protein